MFLCSGYFNWTVNKNRSIGKLNVIKEKTRQETTELNNKENNKKKKKHHHESLEQLFLCFVEIL